MDKSVSNPTINISIKPYLQEISKTYPDITVTSATRNEEENKKVGGVKNSKHLQGKAIDIKNDGAGIQLYRALLKNKPSYIDTVINEGDHIHIEFK